MNILGRPEVLRFLADRLKAIEAHGKRQDSNALLNPKEVGTLVGIQQKRVYEAIKAGELPAEQRPCRGGRVGSLVRQQDAKAWGRTVRRG